MAPGPGKLELVYTPADGGKPTSINVYDFKGAGVALAMYNTDEVSRRMGLLGRVWGVDDAL